MTLEMLVSAALMDYNPTEQAYILKAIEEDTLPDHSETPCWSHEGYGSIRCLRFHSRRLRRIQN